MWLSRNTFPPVPQKKEVNVCSMWSGYSVFSSLTFSHISVTSMNDIPTIRGKKNYGSHTITCVYNIVHVNCHSCTYFFLKQNGKLYSSQVFSHLPLYGHSYQLFWKLLQLQPPPCFLRELMPRGWRWKFIYLCGQTATFFLSVLPLV